MAIKNIENDGLGALSGGAMGGPGYGKYLFWCESCGFKWFGNTNPEDVKECPRCNRVCWSTDDKDSSKKYIRYKELNDYD